MVKFKFQFNWMILTFSILCTMLFLFLENLGLKSVFNGCIMLWNTAIESSTKHFKLVKSEYFINLFLWLFHFNSKHTVLFESQKNIIINFLNFINKPISIM